MIWNEQNQFPFYVRGLKDPSWANALVKFCMYNQLVLHRTLFGDDTSIYGIVCRRNGLPAIIAEPLFQVGNLLDPEKIVSPEKFMKYWLCGTEPQWYDDLNVGDIVTIASYKDNVDEEDYPYTFVSEMELYAGKSLIIEEKTIWYSPSDIVGKKEFNGDFYYYYLGDTGFTWHSSMFTYVNTKNIKKLTLGEIDNFIL